MLCTFHGVWMAFKKDLLTLLEDCDCGKVYGKLVFWCINWYIQTGISNFYCINLYSFLFWFMFGSPEEWLYKLFMHQACVFEEKDQYDMSNKILTNVISDAFMKGHIKQPLKEAIKAFQIILNNKRRNIAFYIRKTIHSCYDAMTTSPCESMNSHIKHSSKASTLNNTRWILCFLLICPNQFVYAVSYIWVHLFWFVCLSTKTTSRFLLLITDGTDACISAIEDSVKQKVQISIINSKLPCKNLFHRKCVYMLHDLFDGRKKQKCVRIFCTSFFLWHNCSIHFYQFIHHVGHDWKIGMDCVEFWIQTTKVWKRGPSTFRKISSIYKCLPCFTYQKRESTFPQMWLATLWEMWYSLCLHTKDHQWVEATMIKIQHWKVFHVHFWLRRVNN